MSLESHLLPAGTLLDNDDDDPVFMYAPPKSLAHLHPPTHLLIHLPSQPAIPSHPIPSQPPIHSHPQHTHILFILVNQPRVIYSMVCEWKSLAPLTLRYSFPLALFVLFCPLLSFNNHLLFFYSKEGWSKVLRSTGAKVVQRMFTEYEDRVECVLSDPLPDKILLKRADKVSFFILFYFTLLYFTLLDFILFMLYLPL